MVVESAFTGFSKEYEDVENKRAVKDYDNAWKEERYDIAESIAKGQSKLYPKDDGRYAYWDQKVKDAHTAFRALEAELKVKNQLFLKIPKRE